MGKQSHFFARIKKTRFDAVYNLPDCRDYYQALQSLDYQIPRHIAPVARRVLREIQRLRGLEPICTVDVACGYGLASALLRHDIDVTDIFQRYSDPQRPKLDAATCISQDRAWYAQRRCATVDTQIIGIDIAANALDYGRNTGLFDSISTDNLERRAPGTELEAELANASLILEAGAIGYISSKTFDHLLGTIGKPQPWVLIAPPRVADSAPVIERLRNHGLVVERMPFSPFRHRRFASGEEKDAALKELARKRIDTTGLEETTGYYFAEAWLARPAHECERSLVELLEEKQHSHDDYHG